MLVDFRSLWCRELMLLAIYFTIDIDVWKSRHENPFKDLCHIFNWISQFLNYLFNILCFLRKVHFICQFPKPSRIE